MTLFVGWDVGAWNCDRGKSRDALCVLGGNSLGSLAVVGSIRRLNARSELLECGLEALPRLCSVESVEPKVIGIDAPLGWPEAFRALVDGVPGLVDVPAKADLNPYIFRQTELNLLERGFRPLSAVRNMIGSQATKGQYSLARSGLRLASAGIWTGDSWTAIEVYPSPATTSPVLRAEFDRLISSDAFQYAASEPAKADLEDALWCALIAGAWFLTRDLFASPPGDEVFLREGWIWVPNDCQAGSGPKTSG